MASLVYNRFAYNLGTAGISLTTDVIKMSLHTSEYVPAKTHNTSTDLTNEIASTSSTDYTAGGFTLANKALTEDDANDYVKWDADDVTLGSATLTARIAVIRLAIDAGSSDLVCAFDFGSNQTATAGDFTVAFSTDGLLQFQST